MAEHRVDADALERAVGVADGQLLGHRGQLGERARRLRVAGRLQHRRVHVEPVGVGQRRQRALHALVARIGERHLGEDPEVELVLLDAVVEVLEGAGRAELARVVGREREQGVGCVVAVDGGQDLVVLDRPGALDRDPRVLLVEADEGLLVVLQLARGVGAPERDGDRLVVGGGGGGDARARAR